MPSKFGIICVCELSDSNLHLLRIFYTARFECTFRASSSKLGKFLKKKRIEGRLALVGF
jgi:hypothetical protein